MEIGLLEAWRLYSEEGRIDHFRIADLLKRGNTS
jgi:hypothetical protein